MNDLEKVADLWKTQINKVKSEEEAKQLILEMKPQLEKLGEKLFNKNASVTDSDENDIDWINELSEYIIDTVRLYLIYHVKGELNNIRLSLSENNPPIIILTINEKEYIVDFITFKNGTDENNRDAHRECYYRNESIWNEYIRFSTCFDINNTGEGLCSMLKDAFLTASIDYVVI